MENTIAKLKTMFTCEDFVVTGSYALHLMGLNDKPNDIDIILIKPTQETLNLVERFQKEHPAKTTAKEGTSLKGIFMFDGIKVDVFVSEKNIPALQLEKFKITPVNHIVKAKKEMGRLKDFLQLRKIAKSIFSENEFQSALDSDRFLTNNEY